MRIGLITTRKAPGREESVMVEVADLLARRDHSLESIFPEDSLIDLARVKVEYDLYVLKAGTTSALAYAGVLDLAGARILNPYAVVTQMKDKVRASRILADAGVRAPEAFIASDARKFGSLLSQGPLVIKPYLGGSQGRGVEIIRTIEELAGLASEQGLMFAQRYHLPEGRDHKIYRIG